MPGTYIPISTTTLSSGVQTVTISSIPQTYTDLVLVISAQQTPAPNTTYLRFNGNSAPNYYQTFLTSSGTTVTYTRYLDFTYFSEYNGISSHDGVSANIYHIFNYALTTEYKTITARTGTGTIGIDLYTGTYAPGSNFNITSLTYGTTVGTLITGSTFTLYGILAA